MSRNRPPDSSRRAHLASAQKIDIPVLVVSALTALFATLFATLLALRPEASDPTLPMPTDLRPVSAPPVNAPPPEPIPRAEPKPEPKPDPTLQTRLRELGIKCAEGANCYPE